MQLSLHPEQLLPLALEHPAHRYARPFSHDFGDILRSNGFCNDRILYRRLLQCKLIYPLLRVCHLGIADLGHLTVISCPFCIMSLDLVILHLLACRLKLGENLLLLFPTLPQRIALGIQFLKFRLDLIHLQGYAFASDGLFLDLELADAAVKLGNRLRNGIHLQTELGSRLINQVNCLIREETSGDIPMRKFYRCYQGIVLDAHLMVVFVPFLESTHDGDGRCR